MPSGQKDPPTRPHSTPENPEPESPEPEMEPETEGEQGADE